MRKDKFLNELRAKLKKLPEKERNDAIEYYNEYFEDAGEENEEKVVKELVSPSLVASQILMEYVIEDNKESKSIMKTFMAIGIGFSALCGLVVVLPLALAFIITVFSLMLTFGILAIALITVSIVFIGAGIFLIIISLFLIIQHIPTAILFLGAGCISLGLGLIVFKPIKIGIVKGFEGIAASISKMINGIKKSVGKEQSI